MAWRDDKPFGAGDGRPDGGRVSAEASRDRMIRKSLEAGDAVPVRPAAVAPMRPVRVSAEATRLAMIRRSH